MAEMSVARSDRVPVKYRGSNLKAEQNFSVAAIAVIKGKADVLDRHGKIVLPTLAVICQRFELPDVDRRQSGTPLTVIDLGNGALLLPKGKATTTSPFRTVQKNITRGVDMCTDIEPRACKGCCNCPKKKKK